MLRCSHKWLPRRAGGDEAQVVELRERRELALDEPEC